MTEPTNTGGPAFPAICHSVNGVPLAPGMTLRHYFAAKAMQAHIHAAWSNPGPSQTSYREWKQSLPPDSDEPDFQAWVSVMACSQADEMISMLEAS